jgi:hypothetical protein
MLMRDPHARNPEKEKNTRSGGVFPSALSPARPREEEDTTDMQAPSVNETREGNGGHCGSGPAHANAAKRGRTGLQGKAGPSWKQSGPTGPPRQKGRSVSYSFIFFCILFIFKTIFKMDFESKSNEIKTTPHNKTNVTT